MNGSRIENVKARQVLDSNGRPVVEVDVITQSHNVGRAGASTGSSVGANESFVLRDNDYDCFSGLSVFKAVDNVNNVIAPMLIGMDVHDQADIDQMMINLDGTPQKSKLGGNAIFATSSAVAYAAAAFNNVPLYQYMSQSPIKYMFSLSSNVVNGGTYAGKTQAFQEFMVLPHSVSTAKQAIRIIVEVFQHLGKLIKNSSGSLLMGNYSGYGAPSDDPFVVFEMLSHVVKELGYEKNVAYAVDCASSEFYNEKEGGYEFRGEIVGRDKIISILTDLSKKHPIAFVEDALWEEDFEGFKIANEKIDSVVIGDDFLCTNLERAKKAVKMGATRGMIFKPNQVGTISEAMETARYMINKGLLVVPSGRAGGTLDSPEKELGLALGCYAIKSGAPRSGSRTATLNFAMRTEEELDIPMINILDLPIFDHLKKFQ